MVASLGYWSRDQYDYCYLSLSLTKGMTSKVDKCKPRDMKRVSVRNNHFSRENDRKIGEMRSVLSSQVVSLISLEYGILIIKI